MPPNFDRFTAESQLIARQGYLITRHYKHPKIEIETIALAILERPGEELAGILTALRFDKAALTKQLDQVLRRLPSTDNITTLYISPLVKEIIDTAYREAEAMWEKEAAPKHFFLAILKIYSGSEQDSQIGRYLLKTGLTYEFVRKYIIKG